MKLSRALVLSVAAILLASSVAHSEVSVQITGGKYRGTLVLGSMPLPDPVPWPGFLVHLTHFDPAFSLNPQGDANGDGRPASAYTPASGYPEVVWSWWDGHDYEIAHSRWDGAQWSAWQVLTDNDLDDLDPMIECDPDGARWISWWRSAGAGQVWFVEVTAPGAPGAEEQVSVLLDGGARPAVASSSGAPRVAYQVETAGVTQIVLAARTGPATWQREIVHQTMYPGPANDGDIDAQVHSANGRLWLDWVEASGVMAFRVKNPATGAWSAVQTESYTWGGATGQSERFAREMARARIRVRAHTAN